MPLSKSAFEFDSDKQHEIADRLDDMQALREGVDAFIEFAETYAPMFLDEIEQLDFNEKRHMQENCFADIEDRIDPFSVVHQEDRPKYLRHALMSKEEVFYIYLLKAVLCTINKTAKTDIKRAVGKFLRFYAAIESDNDRKKT